MIRLNAFKKLVLLFGIIVPLTLFGQKEPSHYRRAPDVLPGTLLEMRTPEFWTARIENPDRGILSLAEIQQMNKAYQGKIKNLPALEHGLKTEIMEQLESWIGLVTVPPDLASLSQEDEKSLSLDEAVYTHLNYLIIC